MIKTTPDRINHICLIILATVALTVALSYTRAILVPLIFAFFLYTILSTGARLISRHVQIRKSISVILMLFVFSLLALGVFYLMFNSIGEFVKGAKQYQGKIFEFISWLEDQISNYGFNVDKTLTSRLYNLPVFSYVQGLTAGVFAFFGKTFLVFIMALFMILGERTGEIQNTFLSEIFEKISKYITIKTIISFTTGFIVWIILTAFGVDLAFMFGVFTVLLNFIPSIGSIVATFLPMPVVLMQYDVSLKTLTIFLIMTFVQVLIGNIIEPKLMGERMDLHPVTVLVFLLFWGLVWGIPGMFLAVPITAIVKMVLSRIESTEGIAQVLAGRIPE